MSMDDRRMQLARDELEHSLVDDVIGIVISYAQYSEIEKVWIALHYRQNENGLVWKTFYPRNPLDDTIKYVRIQANPVDRTSAIKHKCTEWKLGDQLIFNISFGNSNEMFPFSTIKVSTEELVPSAGLQLNVGVRRVTQIALGRIRPQYLAAMQDAIDKI